MRHLLTLTVASTLACQHAREAQPTGEELPELTQYVRQPPEEQPILLVMDRTACEGTCPMYRLLVRADGAVEYFGILFVRDTGRRTARLTRVQLAQLGIALAQVRAAGVNPAGNGCPHGIIDYPGVAFAVPGWGFSAPLCEADAPYRRPSLAALANQLDRLVDSERWTAAPLNLAASAFDAPAHER